MVAQTDDHCWVLQQGVCSESASFDLPAGVLASCVQEVQSALEIALVRRENGSAQRGGEIFVAGGAGTNNAVPCKQASIASWIAHAIVSLSHIAMPCDALDDWLSYCVGVVSIA
jgi:hypothetical protein